MSLVTVFFVFKSFLFPYITSKQISFNILIEVLTAVWLVFIIKYPSFNPFKHRTRLITIGLAAYFLAILISSFFGVDFNLSFWGDIERMLGFFHIFHFLLLYFIIITVFRVRKDWYILFSLSVGVAVVLGLYGMAINQYFSTIGNSAYVAGYMIFNIYFLILLFFKIRNKRWRWLLVVPLLVLLWSFRLSDISGAVVGFGVSILSALFVAALIGKSKKIKIGLFSIFGVTAFLVVLLMLYNQSPFVKNNQLLKVFSDLNWNNITLQTRLISWRAAWDDFPSHPILGTGYGNYAIIFDKHFDSKFYSYTRSETFFDRAHNNIVDIISTTGLIGLIAYLSIFAAAFYYLIKKYLAKKITPADFIILIALLVGYFVQNLAVFDSLVTYISLMMVLGYITWLSSPESEDAPQAKPSKKNSELVLAIVFGVLALGIIYQYNVKVILMLNKTIASQVSIYSGDIVGGYEKQKQAMAYGTPLDRDSRSAFVKIFSSSIVPTLFKNVPKEKGNEILDYAIELAKKNYEYNPNDTIILLTLSEIFNAAAIYNYDNQEKFNNYSAQAIKAINQAVDSSPGRATVYFTKAQLMFSRGQIEGDNGAISILKKAISLNPDFPDGYCNLSQVYSILKNDEESSKNLDKCIDLGQAESIYSASYLQKVGEDYLAKNDFARAIICYKRLANVDPKNAGPWIQLSKIYASQGDNEQAKAAAERAAEIDPKLKSEAEKFISSLQQ